MATQIMTCIYCSNPAVWIDKDGNETPCDDDECLADFARGKVREPSEDELSKLIELGWGTDVDEPSFPCRRR